MTCRIRTFFSRLLLLGAIVLGALWGLGVLNPPDAAAAIRPLEEAPGQVVYQSRQVLQDQYGNRWQAVAFKRIYVDGHTSFELRLVGFPGLTQIDRSQPLTLTDSFGKTLTAVDTSSRIFTDNTRPDPNVGQYDLQSVLEQLQAEIPLELSLPSLNGKTIHLAVPSALVQEWQTVFAQESI